MVGRVVGAAVTVTVTAEAVVIVLVSPLAGPGGDPGGSRPRRTEEGGGGAGQRDEAPDDDGVVSRRGHPPRADSLRNDDPVLRLVRVVVLAPAINLKGEVSRGEEEGEDELGEVRGEAGLPR